ncbi:MAG: hypothetical protein IT288_02320 [Bdellovibrionales bacterium]|nr:hypothetical protein [Bdellovibrionales bacterium]
MKYLLMSLVMLLALSVNEAKAGERSLSINDLVDQYYAAKEDELTVKQLPPTPDNVGDPRYCPPLGPSCTEVACSTLGTFGCDEVKEVETIGRACRGNFDGTCLRAACTRLGTFGCDGMPEVERVARACVGNYGDECVNTVCNRLGSFGCDELPEIEKVLQSCAGN